MIHPSYTELLQVVNKDVEPDEAKIANSRYSIVMATSKRARQIVGGEEPFVKADKNKPLSAAIDELNKGKIKILAEDEELQEEEIVQGENEENLQDESEDGIHEEDKELT